MPIRGIRNPMPKPGPKETGIFSSDGRQKQDGGPKNEAGLLGKSLGAGGRSKPSGKGNASLAHQKPVKQW